MKKKNTKHSEADFLSRPHSINEIAEWLGCTPRFLYKKVADGELKVRKLSYCLARVMPADLKAFLDAGETVSQKR